MYREGSSRFQSLKNHRSRSEDLSPPDLGSGENMTNDLKSWEYDTAEAQKSSGGAFLYIYRRVLDLFSAIYYLEKKESTRSKGMDMMDMMGISAFLAKLIGLYLLIISLLWIFRKHQLEGVCKELTASKGLLAVSAEISLILGLVIVIDHSIWELSWRGLITLIGYLLIIKGILRIAFPATIKKCFSKMMKDGGWVANVIMLGIGIYLTYCGFAYS